MKGLYTKSEFWKMKDDFQMLLLQTLRVRFWLFSHPLEQMHNVNMQQSANDVLFSSPALHFLLLNFLLQ